MKVKLLIFLSLMWQLAYSQIVDQKGVKYGLEAGAFLSTSDQVPFWMRTNQFGEIPLESNIFTLRGDVKKEYAPNDFKSKKFQKLSYGYGARAVVNLGSANQLVLSELFGKIKFRTLELYVGRQKEIFGLLDDNQVGLGNYSWSGNSLPVPKVQLAIPLYTSVLKNGLISVKGNYAHGWFGSADSVKNFYLHQKSLYLRFGKPDWHLKFHGGLNHQVQWGGRPAVPFRQGGTNNFITEFGNDIDAYINVVVGNALTEGGKFVSSGNISGEGGNRAGNHLGTIDLAIEFDTKKSKFLLYKQSIYEDGSLFYLSSIYDGQYGFIYDRLSSSGLQKLTVEYLNTTNQGGKLSSLSNTIPELRGRDNYFNNGTYEDSWTYKGYTIGVPLLMPIATTPNLGFSSDTLSKINSRYILNNRVQALVIGMQTKIKKVESLTRCSFSRNLGNYTFPIDINQLSLQEQITFSIKANQINIGISYDNKGILNQNIGFSLLVRREFSGLIKKTTQTDDNL